MWVKVLHNRKILFGNNLGICILAVEFNGLVSKQSRVIPHLAYFFGYPLAEQAAQTDLTTNF